jgi:hypothetical protein
VGLLGRGRDLGRGAARAIFLVRREEVAQPEPVEIPASQT